MEKKRSDSRVPEINKKIRSVEKSQTTVGHAPFELKSYPEYLDARPIGPSHHDLVCNVSVACLRLRFAIKGWDLLFSDRDRFPG
jgi:hypothetical protein